MPAHHRTVDCDQPLPISLEGDVGLGANCRSGEKARRNKDGQGEANESLHNVPFEETLGGVAAAAEPISGTAWATN